MKKNLVNIVMTLLFMIGQSQDTVVPLHYVKIVDNNMLRIMDSVSEYFWNCPISKELQCCYVYVEIHKHKELGEDIIFTVMPYCESLLVLQAYIWGCDSWAIAWKNELPFLFTFMDTTLFETQKVTNWHIESGHKEISYFYKYYPLPLEQVVRYDRNTFRQIFKMPCIDLSTMFPIRISETKIVYKYKNDIDKSQGFPPPCRGDTGKCPFDTFTRD